MSFGSRLGIACIAVLGFAPACGLDNSPTEKEPAGAKNAAPVQAAGQADNVVPAGLIIEDRHALEQASALQQKMAAGTEPAVNTLGTPTVLLSVPGVNQRPCSGFCAIASSREILLYKGKDIDMDTIAAGEGNPGCASGAGTCLLPIRDYLNAHTPGLPFANYYAAYRLNHSSRSAAASDLETITKKGVGTHRMPLIVLVNPNPPDGTPYCLPGWCGGTTTAGHYLVVNGYEGTYDGSDGSAAIYYRDSWYNPGDQHWANLNNFADTIYYKDGSGSCTSSNYDIVW